MPRINFSQEERERYRRQRMDEFEASVNDLINTWKERPEELAEYLRFKNQFYQYSVRNTMLIYRQIPMRSLSVHSSGSRSAATLSGPESTGWVSWHMRLLSCIG